MSGDAVAEIKSRLDVVEVVGSYVSLQRAGREHKGLCPFHAEKSPSFHVSQERQAWYCFGCQEGGDVFDFVERIERTDFKQALELLATRAGVELERSTGSADRGTGRRRKRAMELNLGAARFYEHVLWQLPAGEAGRELLAQRGVDAALARRFGVGFAPAGGERGDALANYLLKHGATSGELVDAGLAHAGGGGPRDRFRHRFLFPIRDERGQVLGFGGRALSGAVPKYLNTPETPLYHKSAALFGLDLAKTSVHSEHYCVVVEGYFDVVGAHTAGVENVVASSGTALSREQVRTLKRHADSVVLCFDADPAGQQAASRAVDLCAAEGLPARIAVLPDGIKDPDELVRGDPAGFAAVIATAPPEWQVLLDRAVGRPDSIEKRRSAAERAVSLLARIPEATTRDLYVQDVAQRLLLTPAALAADVGAAAAGRRRAPSFTAPERPGGPDPATGSGLADPVVGHPPPPWEEYIGTYVVQRPPLARVLVDEVGLGLSELTHPSIRRLVEVGAGVPPGLGFPLHSLTGPERALAARLLFRRVPEFDPAAAEESLRRAINDCVARVRIAAVRSAADDARDELRAARAAGREEEVAVCAARVSELAAQEGRLRQRVPSP
ncbi:MAG: DNA primase [Candidatus Dormibacteria bacterium]